MAVTADPAFFNEAVQAAADREREAEWLFFRGMSMLRTVSEDMVMTDRTQAVARSNVARACFEGAAYAKREAASLRNRIPPE